MTFVTNNQGKCYLPVAGKGSFLKDGYKIIALSALFGLLTWVIDGVLDHFIFYAGRGTLHNGRALLQSAHLSADDGDGAATCQPRYHCLFWLDWAVWDGLVKTIVRDDLRGELTLRTHYGAVTIIQFPITTKSEVKLIDRKAKVKIHGLTPDSIPAHLALNPTL